MEKIEQLKEVMKHVDEVEIVKDGGNVEDELAHISEESFSEFFNRRKPKLASAKIENAMLALQVYGIAKNVDLDRLDAQALYTDLKDVGKEPVDRTDLNTRIHTVIENAGTIACALDNYNPDILDSMIKMTRVSKLVETHTLPEGEAVSNPKNAENNKAIFKGLFDSALSVPFQNKKGDK